MILQFWAVIRWVLRLGWTFVRVVPFLTMLGVLATLVAQMASLLSMFLPLKIIILMGSDRIPRYFPPSFAEFERDQLIIWLMVATVGFFLLNVIAERVIDWCSVSGSRKLVSRTRKVALFERQDEVASDGYRTYAKALAGGVFSTLVIALFFWIYPSMAYAVLGFIAVSYVGLGFLYEGNARIRADFLSFLPGAVSTLTTLGFLLAFAFIVAQYMLGHPISLIVAIISMLLSRKMFSSISTVVSSVLTLLKSRIKLNSLFFQTQVYSVQEHRRQKDFLSQFAPDSRNSWLRKVLLDLVPDAKGEPAFRWHQSGIPNVVCFWVTMDNGDKAYLLRFFAANRKAAAINEATLLSDNVVRELPAVPLLGSAPVGDMQVHVLDVTGCVPLKARQLNRSLVQLDKELMAVSLPRPLVTRFTNSKPMSPSRMDSHWLERFGFAAQTDADEQLLDGLSQRWESIRRRLEQLPVVLTNPQLGVDNLVQDRTTKRVLLLSWGQWAIEPLGYTWSVRPGLLKRQVQTLTDLQDEVKRLQDVDIDTVILAAHIKELERLFRKQNYQSAIDLLPQVLKSVEKVESSSPAEDSNE